ncbi:Cytosolic protein [Candidatus Magnetomoraceae bacterium gMMP-15]
MSRYDDFDSPWKDILTIYFKDFLEFFFPVIYSEIDWSRGYISLDKELRQITREAEIGGRLADKLIRVWKKNGVETWVLVHVEIQAQKKIDFAHRVYVYNYRIHDLYNLPVASLAVLADEHVSWHPSVYSQKLWGCNTAFKFPMVKILDYRNQTQELKKSINPFAIVVMAHLQTLETKKDRMKRCQYKTELTKNLYKYGFTKADILNLYGFIDWIMVLPEELESKFHYEIRKFEEENKMQYITTAERIGIKKGVQQGLQQGRNQGTLIGQILLAQKLINLSAYSQQELESKDINELKKVFADIEKKLNITYH